MDIINRLSDILNLKEVHQFLSKAISLEKEKNEMYKSWIGFNYDESGFEGIKFYFAFYKELPIGFLESLFSQDQVKLFYRDFEKRNKEAILSSYDYGSGYAIGMKVDLKGKITKAFGYNLKLDQNDETLFSKRGGAAQYLKQKGVYHHLSPYGNYEKTYFYIKGEKEKERILKDLNIAFETVIPVIEMGIGKGFYSGSISEDEKFILLGNYEEVFSNYIESDIAFACIKKDYKCLKEKLNVIGFCPGFYGNGKIQSFYLGSYINKQLQLNTIEQILFKVNNLKNNVS